MLRRSAHAREGVERGAGRCRGPGVAAVRAIRRAAALSFDVCVPLALYKSSGIRGSQRNPRVDIRGSTASRAGWRFALMVDSRACTAYASPRRAGGPTGSVAGQARQADRKTNEKCNRLGKSSTNKRERVLDLSMLPLPIIEVQKSQRVSSCVGEGRGVREREGGGRCRGATNRS